MNYRTANPQHAQANFKGLLSPKYLWLVHGKDNKLFRSNTIVIRGGTVETKNEGTCL